MNYYKLFMITLISCLVFLGCDRDDLEAPIVIVATPLVEFTTSPSELRAGQEVVFNGKFLTGSSVITSWEWNFGDALSSTSNLQNAVFTYAEEGMYSVTLTARDAKDQSLTVTKDITVLEALEDPFEASVAWSFSNNTALGIHNDGSSSPVIGDDGVVYYLESYAGAESKLVAINDLGTSASKKWDATLGFHLRNSPSIGPDGNIYIGAWSAAALNKVSAADGSIIWQGTTNSGIGNCTAAIDADGNVYHESRSAGIFSWAANGTLRWTFLPSAGRFYASPALSADGATLYAMNTNAEVYAINTNDGSAKWAEPLAISGSGTGTSLSIDADGTMYYTTASGVVAVTDNGTSASVKWSYEATGANSSGVVVGLDGQLFVGTTDGLVALNPADGSQNWIYDGAEILESVPAVDSSGNVYVGTSNGQLLVLNAEGSVLKALSLSNSTVNSPVIASDGSVYVEAYDESTINTITLFKITVNNSEGPANSAWPMKGQNAKSTALAI